MSQHIEKMNEKNEQFSQRLKEVQATENELRNRLDNMTTQNNNETMRLSQQLEHLEKENGTILHDISTIPTGSPKKTRQEELEELNEFDNVTEKSVSKYIKRVDKKIHGHTNDISDAYERMHDRLREHFKVFANNVRDKFENEIIHNSINQEFEKLSPIKGRVDDDEDYIETDENSRISNMDDSMEKRANDACLSPELKYIKSSLVRASTNPLEGYQSSINTTAEFGKNNRMEKDLKYMSMKQRHERQKRSTSNDHNQKRENMKKRLTASKMKTSLVRENSPTDMAKTPNQMIKSARLWNAFDTHESYPDKKFTTNVSSPSVPQTLNPNCKLHLNYILLNEHNLIFYR